MNISALVLEKQLLSLIEATPEKALNGAVVFKSGSLVSGVIRYVAPLHDGGGTLFEVAHPAQVQGPNGNPVLVLASFFFTADALERLATFNPIEQPLIATPSNGGLVVPRG